MLFKNIIFEPFDDSYLVGFAVNHFNIFQIIKFCIKMRDYLIYCITKENLCHLRPINMEI